MIEYDISFAGAGRVAEALCKEMYRCGVKINRIVSRSRAEGKALADSCQAEWSSELVFSGRNSVIIVAVPDNSLKTVLSGIRCPEDCIVAHTAGSYGLEVFPATINKKGVFYPLQTFTRGRYTGLRDVPFLIEASDKGSAKILDDLAVTIGGNVHFIELEQRRMVHLAAVFINNFTNYMLSAGNDTASRVGVSFGIFEPLMRETIAKALEIGPEDSQTGPAIRNDTNTIEKHLELLSFSPELQNIYIEITRSIIRHYKKSS